MVYFTTTETKAKPEGADSNEISYKVLIWNVLSDSHLGVMKANIYSLISGAPVTVLSSLASNIICHSG